MLSTRLYSNSELQTEGDYLKEVDLDIIEMTKHRLESFSKQARHGYIHMCT